MPFTFNGIGTKYYGKREKAEDGSYVTTNWIVFLYVPLIPLGSYRVRPLGEGKHLAVYDSQQYAVQRVPLNWRQVLNVYAVPAGVILGLFALAALEEALKR